MRTLATILFTAIMLSGYAQKQTRPATPVKTKAAAPPVNEPAHKKLLIAGRALKDRILLRWAPDDPNAWKLCNQYGYMLERFTVTRDGKMLEKPELLKGKGVIKPQELKEWDSTLLDKNDFVAVIAQAIHGEAFEVEMNKGEAQNLIMRSNELQQRYTMALYGADHSFLGARKAGLGWMDSKVKANETYFYRLVPLVPKNVMVVEPATIYISLKDYYPLPAPSLMDVDFGDKQAALKWDYKRQRTLYNSYIVEKSEDGKNFKSITEKPFTNLTADDMKDANMVTYIDSLQQNDKKYYYRIKGISAFGEVGEASNVIAGNGVKSAGTNPYIIKALPTTKGFTVYWEFPDSLNDAITKFSLKQAPSMESVYTSLTDSLPVKSRSFEFTPDVVAYVMVEATEKNGIVRRSYPFMVQPEDSIPPSAPVGLKGKIDSTGKVTIEWANNTEKDLFGYMIYKSSSMNNEFSLAFDTVWHNNSFTDQVSVNSLNRDIYYAVAAVDKRYNQSKYCQPLLLKKPDIVPPSGAVISGYELNDFGIKIRFVPSTSADVARHQVYRKNQNGLSDWKMIIDTIAKGSEMTLMDSIKVSGNYAYTVVVVDSSQLESQPSHPLAVYIPVKVRGKVNELKVGVNRESREIAVEWSAQAENGQIKSFELYRGGDKQPLSLYKVIDSRSITSFIDKELLVNTKYTYGIRAVFNDGGYSDMQTKTVIY